VPAWLLRLIAGDLAREFLIGGQRVIPDKADASGFVFRHATLESALAAILGVSAGQTGDRPASRRFRLAAALVAAVVRVVRRSGRAEQARPV